MNSIEIFKIKTLHYKKSIPTENTRFNEYLLYIENLIQNSRSELQKEMEKLEGPMSKGNKEKSNGIRMATLSEAQVYPQPVPG